MVIDFRVLRETVSEVLNEWHMSVILPKNAAFRATGEFNYKVKAIPYEHATTEYIALTIGEELRAKLCEKLPDCQKYKLVVRVWESVDRYAEIQLP